MKRTSYLRYVTPTKSICYDGLKQRPIIQFGAVERKWVRSTRVAAPGKLLKPHRSLSFERHFPRESEERRDRIEKPARGGSRKYSHFLFHQLACTDEAARKAERRRREIQSRIELVQEPGGRLNREFSSRIAPCQHRRTEVGDTLETSAHASHKDLATPDAPIVTVPGSIKTHPDNWSIPLAALGEHRSDVCAMMLNSNRIGYAQTRGVNRRAVLRVRVMGHQQFVDTNVIHRKQVDDGLLERLEGAEIVQIANVLADECLPLDDQRDGIFQISAERQQRYMIGKCGYSTGSVPARPSENNRAEHARPYN